MTVAGVTLNVGTTLFIAIRAESFNKNSSVYNLTLKCSVPSVVPSILVWTLKLPESSLMITGFTNPDDGKELLSKSVALSAPSA